MGISGLLPLLKSIQKPSHLRDFAGKTIGVDAYGWLHRGIVACAIDLALDKPTRKHIDFCLHRVRMLIHFGVKPYIVFDGDHLPGKDVTNKERAAKRRDSKRQGMELLKLGKTSQAHTELQKSVDVTPEMAKALIEELKQLNVDYVVAPYEADSQLAYLERKSFIHGIISEDSDLLVFGAKCLITKMDPYGECIVINRRDFTACKDVSFVGWTDAEFRKMAILSGCDYLPNISKMGLMTAHRLLRKHKTVDRVLRQIQFDGKFKVPEGYAKDFAQAEMTFLYQWVYCPEAKRLVNFTEPDATIRLEELFYIGRYYEPEIAVGVATGALHPNTKECLVVPSNMGPPSRPIMPRTRETLVQTPELKKSKSIDSFFKPRRMPLAELDINLFTPSPTLDQVLQQQNRGSWSASPAPSRPPLAQSRTLPATAPRQTSQRVVSTPILGRSVTRPAKRQRLCSDSLATLDAEGGTHVGESSRFFANAACDSSPSANRAGSKRRASQEFGIFSDDSIEEAMSQIPDPNQTPVSQETASASSEKRSVKGQEGQEKDSQASKLDEREPTNTPDTRYNSPAEVEDSQSSSNEEVLPGKFRQLEEMFAYTTDPPRASPSAASPTHRIEKKKSRTVRKPPESFVNTKPTSSLGRIAKQAFNKANIAEFSWSKAKSLAKPQRNGKSTVQEHSSPSSLATSPRRFFVDTGDVAAIAPGGSGADDDDLPTGSENKSTIADTVSELDSIVAKLSPKKRERKSVLSSSPPPIASPAPPPPQQQRQRKQGACKGSEDLLVIPDSQSEGEGESGDEATTPPSKLDLGRFRFGAAGGDA
ncbi:exonuclease [Phyllosticta citriasiana]|uniref:Exonuclease n=1 Tax=Phyllosticta citriasiana TaxID=595635 RepID=A0ABR1K7F3_9PEZI